MGQQGQQDQRAKLDLLVLLEELGSQDLVDRLVIPDSRDCQDSQDLLVSPVHKARLVPLDLRDQLALQDHQVELAQLGKVVRLGPRVLLGHRVLPVPPGPLGLREILDPQVEWAQLAFLVQLATKGLLARKDNLVLQGNKEPLASLDQLVVQALMEPLAHLVQKALWEVLVNQDQPDLRVPQVLLALLVNRDLQVLRVLKDRLVRLEVPELQDCRDHLGQQELEVHPGPKGSKDRRALRVEPDLLE